MHRSGTSAVTRTLSLVGAQLPGRLLEARPDNARGFWESADLLALHDRALESAGTSWEGFSPVPASWYASDAAEGFRREILAVLERDFSAAPLFVVKDPRMCRLVPLWTSALDRFGAEPAFLICFRNPIEVVESLKARNGFHPAKSLLMWLRHVVEAERGSRGARRALVSYEALLADWRAVVRRVGRELGLSWPRFSHDADAAVEAFLDRNMRHERSTLDEVRRRPEILDWARSLYDALIAAEAGSPSSLGEAVDDVGAQLDRADLAFGPVLADLDARLTQAYVSFEQAGSSLAATHAEVRAQEADRGRLRDELAEAQAALGARDARIGDLVAEITAAREQAGVEGALLAEARARADRLAHEVAAGAARHRAAESRIVDLERDLSAEREAKHREVAALEDLMAEKTRALAAKTAESGEAGRAIVHARSALARVQESAQALAAECDAQRARAAALEREVASAQARSGRLEADLQDVLDSTSWRLTRPLRGALLASPRLARLASSAMRLARRGVRFGLPRELRGWWMALRDASWVAKAGLFDSSWYLFQNPEVAGGGENPLVHFLRRGGAEGRAPHPLFDSAWYLRQNPDVAAAGENPLAHFLRRGGAEGRAPHPSFDSAFYLQAYPDVAAAGVNPLVHYLARGGIEGRDPHPLFDTRAYLRANPDVEAAGMNPLVHWVLCGRQEGRSLGDGARMGVVEPPPAGPGGEGRPELPPAAAPSPAASTVYERRLALKIAQLMPRSGAAAAGDRRGRGVLFVSHDASRSGAPLILLALVRRFREQSGGPLFVLLLGGGELEADFARHAITIDLAEGLRRGGTMAEVLNVLTAAGACVGVCNTVATADAAAELKARGLPVVSLVHELPTVAGLLGDDLVVRALRNADRAVASSPSVEEVLRRAMGEAAPPPIRVVPHGLVRQNPFTAERAFARLQVVKQLDLPSDAFLVLGCGFACQRKGFDVFGTVLREVAARPEGDGCHFVWVGGRDEPFATWCRHDVARAGVADRLHLVEGVADPSLYYAAADLFAMTSREDPFPTVVMEAMEAGVPVLAFAGAGDAPLAIGSEAGVTLPYLDATAMARAVLELKGDPSRRRRLGAAGAARVRALYPFERYFEVVADLVQQVR